MLYQDNYFGVSVMLDFCYRQTHCIDDQDKFRSVTDTNNEFTECQIPRKKLQSIGIWPVSLQTFIKTLRNNISEAYKVQVYCLKDSESDSYDTNDMKEKVDGLVRLHEVMEEKLKIAYSEQIQILTLVPDKWFQMYCSEYFTVFDFAWNQKSRWYISKTFS